jgi:hypothetical protein
MVVVAAVLGSGCLAGDAVAQSGPGAGGSGTGTGTVGAGTVVSPSGTVSPSGPPKGTAAEQTHPAIFPRVGGSRSHFTVRLTLADAPGHVGVLATDYRLQLTAPAGRSPQRCEPSPPPANITSGVAGQVVRIALTAPTAGWCVGRYTLTVLLERGPYCPAPIPGQPPPPCPEFATQLLDVGSTRFTVVRSRAA